MDTVTNEIACNLTEPEFRNRKSTVLQLAKDAIVETKELDDGYAFRFPSDVFWISELAELITGEHLCCPFLRFTLTVEAGDGPIWLELTGPEGSKDFLNSIFN